MSEGQRNMRHSSKKRRRREESGNSSASAVEKQDVLLRRDREEDPHHQFGSDLVDGHDDNDQQSSSRFRAVAVASTGQQDQHRRRHRHPANSEEDKPSPKARRPSSPSEKRSAGTAGAAAATTAEAVRQAARRGKLATLNELLESSSSSTTSSSSSNYGLSSIEMSELLMRAAQEGHDNIVEYCLKQGAPVNRRNRAFMTALLLASQSGHANICRLLLQHGAKVDATTDKYNQNSTALILACQRGHGSVVRILVTEGCDLWVKDLSGRHARYYAILRYLQQPASIDGNDYSTDRKAVCDLLDATVQVQLMQRQARRERSLELMRHYHLLQQERAGIPIFSMRDGNDDDRNVSIHEIHDELWRDTDSSGSSISSSGDKNVFLPLLRNQRKDALALLRAVTLPAPLVKAIGEFLPLPHLWTRRLGMLTKCSVVDAAATITQALDLCDEVLEEGGFLEACDAAKDDHVTPPADFVSWHAWKVHLRKNCRVSAELIGRASAAATGLGGGRRLDVTTATVQGPADPDVPTFVELRRQAGYFKMIANSPQLVGILSAFPYSMPPTLVQQLVVTSDLASLARRMNASSWSSRNNATSDGDGLIHFAAPVAMDLVMLASCLCSWYWREREVAQQNPSAV